MNGAKLVARDVQKRFGGFTALRGVSFAVEPRGIHAFIGPNGAGKTTLFNCLTGTTLPSAGRVLFDDRDVTRLPPHRRARLGIARSFQVTNLFQSLTVFESLRLAAQAQAGLAAFDFLRPKERLRRALEVAEAVVQRLALQPWRHVRAGELSHGQQRILEIGLALAGEPSTLLLDEPMAGMGVDDIETVKRLIVELGRDHTIILIEHNMNVVLDVSRTVSVMHQGAILAEGPPDAIRRHPEVRAAYLGSQG
ncbi:MAG TPA: ABC transporter ATP-binding protein [Acetobacteraceae bacterium]|nr:ABC transporter ATP-binding protein [Acetobacteraceae bacterium]